MMVDIMIFDVSFGLRNAAIKYLTVRREEAHSVQCNDFVYTLLVTT